MTTQSVKEKAREAQRQEFEAHADNAPAELQTLTLGIYDQIDALDGERRSLLIHEVLLKIGMTAHDLDDLTERAVLSTLAGIGNYVNEVERESRDLTSTGDRAVDSIIEDIGSMLTLQFRAMMGDSAEHVEAAAARVKERVKAGEDIEDVIREEEAAMKETLAALHGAPAPKTREEPSTGLYL